MEESRTVERAMNFGMIAMLYVARTAISLTVKLVKNVGAATLAGFRMRRNKVMGKTSVKRLQKHGLQTQVIKLSEQQYREFAPLAKRYGVLFAVRKNKDENMRDVLINVDDVAQANHVLEELTKMKAAVDVKTADVRDKSQAVKDTVEELKTKPRDIRDKAKINKIVRDPKSRAIMMKRVDYELFKVLAKKEKLPIFAVISPDSKDDVKVIVAAKNVDRAEALITRFMNDRKEDAPNIGGIKKKESHSRSGLTREGHGLGSKTASERKHVMDEIKRYTPTVEQARKALIKAKSKSFGGKKR